MKELTMESNDALPISKKGKIDVKYDQNIIFLPQCIVAVSALIIGIGATVWSLQHNVILSYGDAEAHLNIAKKVVSALTPGLTQIGGVWLPLPHILMIPFVTNTWLWKTGISGSIVSVLAFCFAAVMLYKLAFLITNSKSASYLAPMAFITNPNTLYLATTPMTEILLFACVAASVFYFIKWIQTQDLGSILASSFFVFLASLTRYDGWFLVCIESFIIFVSTYFRFKKNLKKAEGITMIFSFLGFFGIILWLMWNVLIFGDMFFFLKGQYSSNYQQQWFLVHGYLPTYHNIFISIKYYLTDTIDSLGRVSAGFFLVGLIIYCIGIYRNFSYKNLLPLLLLLFPFAFYVISLYTGQASLILPEYVTHAYRWNYSNVRYGIQMILPFSILLAYLGKKSGSFKIFLFCALLLQNIYLVKTNNVIAYIDGTKGLSAAIISKGPDAVPTENWLLKHYDNGLVLMDDYRKPVSLVTAGIPMQNYITSGTKPYWEESLQDPTRWAKWIVLQESDTDSIYSGLAHKDILQDKYINVFRSGTIFVFKIRNSENNFVQKRGNQLLLQGKPYVLRGVNIYDLAQTPKPTIAATITALHAQGITTIRLWGFNKNGTFSNDDFDKLDFILFMLQKEKMQVIITLGNNWNDYGGKQHFEGGTSDQDISFYTNSNAQIQYENHIKNIVLHYNPLTMQYYKNDASIMSWELINEPRIENDRSNLKLIAWIDNIGRYIASLDTKHLLAIGTEGFLNPKTNGSYHEAHGSDFNAVCQDPIIDLCSAHIYPKYIKGALTQNTLENTINEWNDLAGKADKPFYLGEIGYDLHTSSTPSLAYAERSQYLSAIKNILDRKHTSGGLLWNFSQNSDSYFSLSFSNPEDKSLLDLWIKNPQMQP